MSVIRYLAAAAIIIVSALATAADGLIVTESPYSAMVTMDRLEKQGIERGLTVFARIDHAAGASEVGQSLRPTELLIFGNPQGGTAFMACVQSVGIDLPLKALVWEDASSRVWLGYNAPAFLAQRHGAENCQIVAKLQQVLEQMTKAVVAD